MATITTTGTTTPSLGGVQLETAEVEEILGDYTGDTFTFTTDTATEAPSDYLWMDDPPEYSEFMERLKAKTQEKWG